MAQVAHAGNGAPDGNEDKPGLDGEELKKNSKQGRPRKRVSQACDKCRSRKDKCDGKKPVRHSSRAQLPVYCVENGQEELRKTRFGKWLDNGIQEGYRKVAVWKPYSERGNTAIV